MAKIKFGAIVTDMRGKVGSQVFSRNKSGAYARSFKVNVISATASQVTARMRLSTLSSAWRSLTQVQRNSFNEAVTSFKHTNIFGSIISPSGFDLYVKLNCNLVQIDVAPISTAPTPGLVQNVASLSVVSDATTPAVTISWDASTVSIDHYFVISATKCLSPGVNYVKNLLRSIVVVPQSQAVPYDATAVYQAKFTDITDGDRISISIVSVNSITGQKSAPLYATCIVAAGAGLDFTEALDTGIPLT